MSLTSLPLPEGDFTYESGEGPGFGDFGDSDSGPSGQVCGDSLVMFFGELPTPPEEPPAVGDPTDPRYDSPKAAALEWDDPVTGFRIDRFQELGFDLFESLELALCGADWHEAERMLEAGADLEDVKEILV